MRSDVETNGFDGAIERISRIQSSLSKSAAVGVYSVAVAIFIASQAEVPRRTGTLMASGYIGTPADEGDGSYSIAIGYRGPKYTRIVHYNQHLRHVTGKSYFLIDPKRRFSDQVADSAARAVEAELNT